MQHRHRHPRRRAVVEGREDGKGEETDVNRRKPSNSEDCGVERGPSLRGWSVPVCVLWITSCSVFYND